MVTLTDNDRKRIAQAVADAETRTSGEICCVLTEEASHYREVPIAWAAFAALVVPAIALGFDLRPEKLAQIVPDWAAVEGSELHRYALTALASYAIVQVLVFAAVALLASIPSVRRVLTPAFVKRHRVRAAAHHHFASLTARLGASAYVMIYASRLDRMVEILVSEAAHKACDAAAWRQAADAIGTALEQGRTGEGFVTAIAICGAELAKHFPPSADHPNRMPDTLIEE